MGIQIKFTNGEYERHKARNVDLQRKNVDFFTSFSPSASYVTIRLVLALTELPHWYGVDLDTTGAFISAPLPSEEQVHLKNILGYDLPKGSTLTRKREVAVLAYSLSLLAHEHECVDAEEQELKAVEARGLRVLRVQQHQVQELEKGARPKNDHEDAEEGGMVCVL